MPAWLGGAIAGVASLWNGSRNRRAQREANEANTLVERSKDAVAAGFNPLFALGGGVHIPQQPVIGNDIANAGAYFGEAYEAQRRADIENTQIEMQNELLSEQIKELKNHNASYMDRYGQVLPLPGAGGLSGDDYRAGHVGRDARALVESGASSGFGGDADISVLPDTEADIHNFWIYVHEPISGQKYRYPNPELFESSVNEIGGSAGLHVGFGGAENINQILNKARKRDAEDGVTTLDSAEELPGRVVRPAQPLVGEVLARHTTGDVVYQKPRREIGGGQAYWSGPTLYSGGPR